MSVGCMVHAVVAGLPRTLREEPLLLVSPHPDDAALSCAALLARVEPIDVLTVFAGSPDPPSQGSWDRVTGFVDSTESSGDGRRTATSTATCAMAPSRPSTSLCHWTGTAKRLVSVSTPRRRRTSKFVGGRSIT